MNKSKMTFAEGLKLSWKRELEIGDPRRIIRLAFATVWYGVIYVLFYLPAHRLYYRLKKYLILGYYRVRNSYILALHSFRVWTGLYPNERLKIKRNRRIKIK